MAFLTIAGTTIGVSVSSATQKESTRIGSDSRAYSGAYRSTVRAEKRVWEVTTKHLSTSEEAALRTATALGAQVTVNGDMVSNVAVTCRVFVGEARYVAVKGGRKRVVTLRIEEV
jgi:hypothetical protein